MPQVFKSIYFSDYPASSAREKNLTLAFGDKDQSLYKAVQHFSSLELRELIGYQSYEALKAGAEKDEISVNTFCLRSLRKEMNNLNSTLGQFPLPGVEARNLYQLDPIQSTFRGGLNEPLHSWYPFLEGYSPRFVEQILKVFSPHAESILDPFSGTGTTALTAIRLGKNAYYAEINPLLQFLTETKARVLILNRPAREKLASALEHIYYDLENTIKLAAIDYRLHLAYKNVFNKSQFFSIPIYEQVLKARTVIDRVACTDPLAANLLTVAVLSSLIPSSRLIRRGDLRFRKGNELKGQSPEIAGLIKKQLEHIIQDIKLITSSTRSPVFLCDDAHKLGSLPPVEVDTVITSPPYLNGTNYFRNTKLELWFLRCLRQSNDLSEFRFKAITSGINDVTNQKDSLALNCDIGELLSRLKEHAYDQRIPKMVSCYFNDMNHVFIALKRHLKDNANIIIDIGDSAYGNIHVPTNELLKNLLSSNHYVFKQELVLRKRMSRGGFPLQQVLLVFQHKRSSRRRINEFGSPARRFWSASWDTFKANLPHQHDDYAKRNWGHPLHSLCSYQGKMKPSLAHHLVKIFALKGGKLLDPMAGVGTIPFEAARQGITSYAFDINPAAVEIAAAKLGRPEHELCIGCLSSLEEYLKTNKPSEADLSSAQAVHFNGPLINYFHSKTFEEVLLARRYFLENPPASASESLVLSSLLHILHGNRPYALSRRSHPLTPYAPSGPTEYRPLVPRLTNKVIRSLDAFELSGFVEGKSYFQDATSWWPLEIDNLDAIITSPPFFDSTRFYLSNWMRLWFCGWDAHDFKTKPLAFVEEKQKSGMEIYVPIFRQARERLKPGGVFVLHLGKSFKCDMAEYLSRVAKRWFRISDTYSESVEHCEKHGIRDKGSVKQHQYLILE